MSLFNHGLKKLSEGQKSGGVVWKTKPLDHVYVPFFSLPSWDTGYVYTASGNIQCEQTCCILHTTACGILYKHSQVFSPSLTSENINREICTGDLHLDVNSICGKFLHTGLTQLSISTLGCAKEYSNLNSSILSSSIQAPPLLKKERRTNYMSHVTHGIWHGRRDM